MDILKWRRQPHHAIIEANYGTHRFAIWATPDYNGDYTDVKCQVSDHYQAGRIPATVRVETAPNNLNFQGKVAWYKHKCETIAHNIARKVAVPEPTDDDDYLKQLFGV